MAEVDEGAVPGSVILQDCLADIDLHMNDCIRRSRRGGASGTLVVERVFDELGDTLFTQPWLAKIEDWINRTLPLATTSSPGKRFITPFGSTKYRDVASQGWAFGGQRALAPVILCGGVRMGADKVGHFFQLGHDYYLRRARGVAHARAWGHSTETGNFGLGMTGVYSNADLAANEAGMQFYDDLRRRPSGAFSLRSYVSQDWDERQNPCTYNSGVGGIVWKNILEGPWQGEFTHPGAAGLVPISAEFYSVTVASSSGRFAYRDSASAIVRGSFSCVVDHRRNRHGHIEGVSIAYDWISGTNSGKGRFQSHAEDRLEGRWGYDTSNSNGGTWRLHKI